MPKNLWPFVLKGLVGFLIGLCVWAGLSVPYTRLLASISEAVVRAGEHQPVTRVVAQGTLMLIQRSDFPPSRSPGTFGVESTDITFNVILLTTLFAAAKRTFSDRNVFGFTCAAVALVFVHVAAVVSFVEGYYAQSFGAWSLSHYGPVARYFWSAAPYFYSVVGSYGFTVALWCVFRPDSRPVANELSHARTARRRFAR